MFMQVVAPLVHIDWPTVLWCNQIALTTVKSVQIMLDDLGVQLMSTEYLDDKNHIDIRMETLMPKVGCSSEFVCLYVFVFLFGRMYIYYYFSLAVHSFLNFF